jgi:Holliday junction resolvase RusA-like endonuclease
MSRRDSWQPRPCVLRYRAFCDEIRLRGALLPDAYRILFNIAMPSSWPAEKRNAMRGLPHESRPDTSNLVKALEDALVARDERLANCGALKRWADEHSIVIVAVDLDHDLNLFAPNSSPTSSP